MKRRRLVLALIATAVVLVGVRYAQPAQPAGAATTTPFNTPGTFIFNIPAGVTVLDVNLQGSPGGNAPCGTLGGQGGRTRALITVPAGTTQLQVNVGGAAAGPTGGSNGGGNGLLDAVNANTSAGGGGATDVRLAPFGLANRIMVAGGGGGGGGCGEATGGAGGSAGNPSLAGGNATGLTQPGGGGGAGTAVAVGAAGAGSFPGTAGVGAVGGNGGLSDNNPHHGLGGGGGGGLFGGGGGGAPPGDIGNGGGGGGGAGSNFINGTTILNFTGAGASFAQIRILTPPAITKAFAPASIQTGATSILTVTVDNSSQPGDGMTGIGFSDTLPTTPSQMTVAAGTVTNTCGGTLTGATVGSTSFSLTGGAIPAGGITLCTVSVPVTTAGAGTFVNTTGVVTSNESGPGAAATATLLVSPIPATATPPATATATSTPVTPATPVAATPTVTPTVAPVFVQGYYVTPVIPVFQNPAAGAVFNPIAKTPTPRPVVAAAAPAVAVDPGFIVRPPNTGDGGLQSRWLTSW